MLLAGIDWEGFWQLTPWISLEDPASLLHPSETDSHHPVPLWKLWGRVIYNNQHAEPFALCHLCYFNWMDYEERHRRQKTGIKMDTGLNPRGPGLCWWPGSLIKQTPRHPSEDRDARSNSEQNRIEKFFEKTLPTEIHFLSIANQ